MEFSFNVDNRASMLCKKLSLTEVEMRHTLRMRMKWEQGCLVLTRILTYLCQVGQFVAF